MCKKHANKTMCCPLGMLSTLLVFGGSLGAPGSNINAVPVPNDLNAGFGLPYWEVVR